MGEKQPAAGSMSKRDRWDLGGTSGPDHQYPDVRLIDFQPPERNRFTAINQFGFGSINATEERLFFPWRDIYP